jgi:hypothetical protein
MDDKNEDSLDRRDELETLEDPATVVETADTPAGSPVTAAEPSETAAGSPEAAPAGSGPAAPPRQPRFGGLKRRLSSVNVYLLIFILVLVIAGVIGVVAYLNSQHGDSRTQIQAQTLDAKALEQLANTDTTVGSSNQVLNVQSSAIFAGKVLVRDSLEVAGGLQIGGSLNLSGVSVSGSSSFGQVQINKNLAVVGDSALQGALTVQKSISVNGSGTFNGPVSATQFTADSLQLNGELTLTHHITAGGPTPSRVNGSALGGGGTATVSGSDTSGTVTINTGAGPAAGCFITVNFTSRFHATPRVLITPVGSAAGGLAYYANRTTSGFSVCDASTPPANTSFGFDYFVLD